MQLLKIFTKFKYSVLIFISIISIILNIELLKLLVISDVSVEPIHQKSNIDLVDWEHWPTTTEKSFGRAGVYLVSYADGKETFFSNQDTLVRSALNKGIDFFMSYRRSLIPVDFYLNNKSILDSKHGAGMWLWKPWMLLEMLKNTPENTIIIYLDTGFTLHRSIKDWIDLVNKHNILMYKTPINSPKLGAHAKRDAFIVMGCDEPKCRYANAIMSGFLVIKNNDISKKFISDWLEYCKNEDILSRSPSKLLPEYPEFMVHQDDESLLSILHYKTGIGHVVPYEYVMQYASLHHRQHHEQQNPKNGIRISLLDEIHKYTESIPPKKKIRKYERLFLNSKFMILVRKYVNKYYYE